MSVGFVNSVGQQSVPNNGGIMTGLLVLSGDPVVALGACTKQYADAIAQGLSFKDACYAGSTANLPATYVNGLSGVGATLTSTGLAAFTIDGTTPALNARILIKNQTTTYQNGIYTLTTTAVVGVSPWVLTRSTDYNQASEIQPGDAVFTDNGTVNAALLWLQTATVTTIGTDPIVFSQFGANNVTSVTGTTNRITSTGGTTPIIDISTNYIGQNSITTVGALTSGSLATGFTPVTVPLGGTGLSTATTAYAPIISGTTATGNFQVASTGLANVGYVLTSNGSSAVPSWQPPGSAGGAVLLSTINVSNQSTINLYNLFDSTYDSYWIEFIGLQIDVNTTIPWLRFGTGAGPTIQSGGSDYQTVNTWYTSQGSGSLNTDNGNLSKIIMGPENLGTANDAAATISGNLYLYNAASSSLYTQVLYDVVETTSAGSYCVRANGSAHSTFTTPVTSLQFTTDDAGTAKYVSGKVKVYGISSASGTGSGKIVQVVYGSTTTTTNLTGTYTSVVSATITPTSASNHILIMGDISFSSSSGTISIGLKLYRAGSAIVTYGGSDTELYKEGTTQVIQRDSPIYYDAPATTSSTVYAFYARYGGGGSAAAVNFNGDLTNIILMEIAL